MAGTSFMPWRPVRTALFRGLRYSSWSLLAPIPWLVRVGSTAHGDERDDLSRGASAGISYASGKPLASGGAGGNHAGAYLYDLAFPDDLAISQEWERSRLWLLP